LRRTLKKAGGAVALWRIASRLLRLPKSWFSLADAPHMLPMRNATINCVSESVIHQWRNPYKPASFGAEW
jgi:hypothetical protein